MTTPKYQKIPGEKLTLDQFDRVQQALLDKFDYKWPCDLRGHHFYFTTNGQRFLEVWS